MRISSRERSTSQSVMLAGLTRTTSGSIVGARVSVGPTGRHMDAGSSSLLLGTPREVTGGASIARIAGT